MMQKSFYRSGIRALAGVRPRLAPLQVGGDLLQCGEVVVDIREIGVNGVDRQVSGTRGSPGGDVGSQSAWRMAMYLPGRLQNSHRNGGRVFLIFVADPRPARLFRNFSRTTTAIPEGAGPLRP